MKRKKAGETPSSRPTRIGPTKKEISVRQMLEDGAKEFLKNLNFTGASFPGPKGDTGPQGPPGASGPGGLPTGGATGTVLTKNSATDFDASFLSIPADAIELNAADFGIFSNTTNVDIDCTAGWDLLNDWINARGAYAGRSTPFTTTYLLRLPHGRITTQHVYLDFPEGGGISQPRLIIQGAGAFANGTEIIPPASGWVTTGVRGAFLSITGLGFQINTLTLDGVYFWNRWLNAPTWMVGGFLNCEFGFTTAVAVCDSWIWGDVNFKDWPVVQFWGKAGQNGSGAPIQDGMFHLLGGDRLSSGSATADGLRFSGGWGPFNIDKCKVPARFASVPTCIGVSISPDTRTGLVIASVSSVTNKITLVNPGFLKTQDSFQLNSSGGATPWGGLSLDTDYWVVRDDVTDDYSFRVANSAALAATRTARTLTATVGTALLDVNRGGSGGNTVASNAFHIKEIGGDNNGIHLLVRYSRPISIGAMYAESILTLVDAAGGFNSDCYIDIYGEIHAIFGTGAGTPNATIFKTAGEPYVEVRHTGQIYTAGWTHYATGAGFRGNMPGLRGDSIYAARTIYNTEPVISGSASTVLGSATISALGAEVTSVIAGMTVSGLSIASPVPLVTGVNTLASTVTMSVAAALSGPFVVFFGAGVSDMGTATHSAAWTASTRSYVGDTNSNTSITNIVPGLKGVLRGTLVVGPDIPVSTTVFNVLSSSSVQITHAATSAATAEAIQFATGSIDLGYDGYFRVLRFPTNGTDDTPNTTAWLRGLAMDGSEVTMAVGGGTGDFFEMDVRGGGAFSNISHSGHGNNGTERFPPGAIITLMQAPLNQNLAQSIITNLVLPVHVTTVAGASLNRPGAITGQLTRSGGTANATTFSVNGLLPGDLILVSGASGSAYNTWSKLTTTGPNSFSYLVSTAVTTPDPATSGVTYITPGRRINVPAAGARPGDPNGIVIPPTGFNAAGVFMNAVATDINVVQLQIQYALPLYSSSGTFIAASTDVAGQWGIIQGR